MLELLSLAANSTNSDLNISTDELDQLSNIRHLNLSFDHNFLTYIKVRNLFTWINLVTILIGLVGNFLSFFVLINPKMRTTTNMFLSNLCICSFIALLGLLINSIFYEIAYYYGPNSAFYIISVIYPFVYPITNTFQMACIMLTVCVSVNQFLCIYFSRLKNYSKMSTQAEYNKTIKIVVIVYILSTIYCIPYWLKFKYTHTLGLHETQIGKSDRFNKIVHFWMYLPIVYLIPFSILIITNSYLMVKLVVAKRRRVRLGMITLKSAEQTTKRTTNGLYKTYSLPNRRAMSKSRKVNRQLSARRFSRENSISISSNFSFTNQSRQTPAFSKKFKSSKLGRTKVTCMLIAVVFLFFICQFPNLVLHIFQAMNSNNQSENHFEQTAFYRYGLIFAKFLLIINLSFNFSCYCFFSEKFREVLQELLFSRFNY